MEPILEAPRELADLALLPLKPLELPPKPLALGPLLDGMLRLPILSPPPLPPRLEALGALERPPAPPPVERFIPPALGAPDLLAVPPPADRFAVPALGDEPRDPPCWRALACRLLIESPRAVPPNLSAVARSA